MKNLELKAKYPDQKAAIRIAEEIGAEYEGILHQEDIYFKISPGRLKLRIVNNNYELIYYKRANIKTVRESEYEIFRVKDGRELFSVLKGILPVTVIVKKKRVLYIWQNVRIHIDTVKGLGKFLEFEAVCKTKKDSKDAPSKLKKLIRVFNIKQKDMVSSSYSELILNKK